MIKKLNEDVEGKGYRIDSNGVCTVYEDGFCIEDSDCNKIKKVIIKDGVTTIGHDAFDGCTWLISVKIPNSVTSIGAGAFWCCHRLISVNIPDSVTSIGQEAFGKCDNLSSIIVPNSVTTIGDWAFMLSDLKLEIPDSVVNIGRYIISKEDNSIIYCSENSKIREYCEQYDLPYEII